MVDLISDFAMNRVVSHLAEVQRDVHAHTDEVGAVAQARLAGHHRTGEHEVTTTHGDTDGFVNLEGVHPESVEFGHWIRGKFATDPPKFAQGLYIITGAADMDVTPKQGPRRR